MVSNQFAKSSSLFIVVFFALGAPSLSAAGSKAPANSTNRETAGYVLALGVADKFMQAWQASDVESGTVLLSTSARKHLTTDALEQYFSGHENAAYEISRGKLVKR